MWIVSYTQCILIWDSVVGNSFDISMYVCYYRHTTLISAVH